MAYVEPSIRPDDGRYGENPNRMQQYYQYQVILKPDPGNPQELYLQSLEALGIDPREHDIRFVEDNWEVAGAGRVGAGLGGLAGRAGDHPVHLLPAGRRDRRSSRSRWRSPTAWSASLMALQDVDTFLRHPLERRDLTYGELHLQGESRVLQLQFRDRPTSSACARCYDVYEGEAQRRAGGRAWSLPAYDYVLKCSHLFNVLDCARRRSA